MNPYPEGTLCVITWHPQNKLVGSIVRCGSKSKVTKFRELFSQWVTLLYGEDSNGHSSGYYPVERLRPLEDPDEEVVEEEKEIVYDH